MQSKEEYDSDIDLMALILFFYKHWKKVSSMMIIGLTLGLTFTFQQTPKYLTEFKVIFETPIYNEIIFSLSDDLNILLAEASLKPNKLPKYEYNKIKSTFQVESFNPNTKAEVEKQFKEIVSNLNPKTEEIRNWVLESNTSGFFVIRKGDQVRVQNLYSQDPLKEFVKDYKILYGPTIKSNPSHIKLGLLGIIMGLLLTLFWIFLLNIRQEIKKRAS